MQREVNGDTRNARAAGNCPQAGWTHNSLSGRPVHYYLPWDQTLAARYPVGAAESVQGPQFAWVKALQVQEPPTTAWVPGLQGQKRSAGVRQAVGLPAPSAIDPSGWGPAPPVQGLALASGRVQPSRVAAAVANRQYRDWGY